jgi:hypothetical protein
MGVKFQLNARMRCPISPPPSRKRREPLQTAMYRCSIAASVERARAPQNVPRLDFAAPAGEQKKEAAFRQPP